MKALFILLLVMLGLVPTEAMTLNLSTDLVALGIATANMVPNQSALDSGPLLEKAVRYATSHQVNSIVANKGSYYFLSASTYNSSSHVVFAGSASGSLTIDFQNSDLYFALAGNHGFFLTGGTNVTLQNFTVDFLQQLYTQATITAVNAAQRQLQFTVQPGWQNPSALNSLIPNGSAIAYVYVFRNGLPWVGFTRMAAVSPFTDSSVTLTNAVSTSTVGAVQVGDVAVIQVRLTGDDLLVTNTTGATLRNIKVYAGGVGVRLFQCAFSLLEHVEVMPRPGTNRLISTVADGIQPQQLGLNNTIRLCRSIRTCDDGFSPSTFVYASVQSVLGNSSLQVQGDATTALAGGTALSNGSTVVFEQASDGAVLGSAVVVSQAAANPINGLPQKVLNFDRTLPSNLVGTYLYPTDAGWRGGNLRLERNTVQQQGWARGISLWGLMNATLCGNYIYQASMAGIDIRHQLRVGDWIVPPVAGLAVTNNVIDGTITTPDQHSLIQLGGIESCATSSTGAPMSQSPHQNIVITNNFIANPGRAAIWIGNTAGGSVSGNYLLHPNDNPNISRAYSSFASQELQPLVLQTSTGVAQGAGVIDQASGRVYVTDTGYRQLAAYAPGTTIRLHAYSLGSVGNPTVTLTDADGKLWSLAVVGTSTHFMDVQLPAGAGLGGAVLSFAAEGISRFGTLFLDTQDNLPAINQYTYQISPSATAAPASATTLSFLVVTQPEATCQVTATDLFVTPGGGGSGTGVVTVGLSENTGAARTATIHIAGQTIVLTQAGAAELTPTQLWRQQKFGTPANSGIAADTANPDGDAWTNIEEYILGTNPLAIDNSSLLHISPSGSNIVLTFTAIQASGVGYDGHTRFYDLESTTNLVNPSSWTGLPGYASIIGANQTVTVTLPQSAESRFYRLAVWLQ